MERKQISVRKWTVWIFPAIGLLCGMLFYFFVSGCSFLGILLAVSALIWAAFNLLGIWKRHNPVVAKRVLTALRVLLILVLIAALITLVPILRGPAEQGVGSDYVIVLGAGVRGTEPSEILQDRIDQAYLYLTKNPVAVCVATGGKGSDENISEAQCIYDHLTALGIDGSRIWLEEQATSTIENFRYSIALIQEKTGAAPEAVTVLSNEFHLYRASRMAEDCGLKADFIAAPTSHGLIRVSYTIREVFALWKYLILGG